MKKLKTILVTLGELYEIKNIDAEEVIYRDLGNGYDFEVSGITGSNSNCVLYVWKTVPHKEIVGIYENIPTVDLRDVLGHFAYVYRNLAAQIRVEREE